MTLVVIIALYFSAISLQQTHASEFSDMQTVAISVHSLDPGNSERDMSPYSPQCADQVHCNSAAILPGEAPSRAADAAGAISSTQAFVRQQFSPFPAPPPKFS
ncbi:MAG: hypothetical protein KUA43_07320 [Hoeflea sp.]|uniref:hypothetical protein n=1 Tax=Hoeflea sp. TaxID=1940281 RepID=UPI001D2E7722|nr:hypothetical protein [Hoeflea sp.]MBU4529315.1 hypothetical protein [Alphaproteobacteria bacterium]MBU4545482.1 hypothetical protein [Alphaproteobacteria bacterium]MBU4550197.1 hypothetical protein [Alphaproteobacteria bacterium]MBV1723238.1 hypothetical protein [Hoeflea sp.]MBV1782911.1 hypothetical protein [Hoeflea sp.]